jgi:HK97 gp10 family phage protein
MAVDEIKVTGLKEIERVLQRLPARLGEKVIRAALRAGAQVIRKDAQSKVPILKAPDKRRKPGTVKKAITIKRSKQDKFGVYLGVKGLSKDDKHVFKNNKGTKAANNPDDPFYWFFLEFGTAKMPAKPFLRPAFEARKFEALRKFEEYCKKRIAREADKLAKEMGSNAA